MTEEPLYSVGLTERQMTLLIMCIKEEPTTDEEEIEIAHLKKLLKGKRYKLRRRMGTAP